MKNTASIGAMPKMPGNPSAGEDVDSNGDNFDTKNDMMTMINAHRIKSNKPRHAAVKAMAKKHMAGMQAIVNDGTPVNNAPPSGTGPNYTD